MESLDRETVLWRANYGTSIYSHILSQFYPGEIVMHIRGRDCGICRNPFDGGSLTLHIFIVKTDPSKALSPVYAYHEDLSGTIPTGDALLFAELYYKQTGQELLDTICRELHLYKRDNWYARDDAESMTPAEAPSNPIAMPTFSFYRAPVTNLKPYRDITLIDAHKYLTSEYARSVTETLRSMTDHVKAREYKKNNFDYVTFSGKFTSRNATCLVNHSGYLCLDFDDIDNLSELRARLLTDPNIDTLLLFTSPSGNGLKWVVGIDTYHYSHQDNFKAYANYVNQTYGIQVDKSGKDIPRACFLPYDPDAYIHPSLLDNNGN